MTKIPAYKTDVHMSRVPKAEDQGERVAKELAMRALVTSIAEELTASLKEFSDAHIINSGNEDVLLKRSRILIDSTRDHFKSRVVALIG